MCFIVHWSLFEAVRNVHCIVLYMTIRQIRMRHDVEHELLHYLFSKASIHIHTRIVQNVQIKSVCWKLTFSIPMIHSSFFIARDRKISIHSQIFRLLLLCHRSKSQCGKSPGSSSARMALFYDLYATSARLGVILQNCTSLCKCLSKTAAALHRHHS